MCFSTKAKVVFCLCAFMYKYNLLGGGVLSLCKFAVYHFICICISQYTICIHSLYSCIFTWKVLCSGFIHAVIMVIRTAAKAYRENLLLQRAVLLLVYSVFNFQFTAFCVSISYIISSYPYW